MFLQEQQEGVVWLQELKTFKEGFWFDGEAGIDFVKHSLWHAEVDLDVFVDPDEHASCGSKRRKWRGESKRLYSKNKLCESPW